MRTLLIFVSMITLLLGPFACGANGPGENNNSNHIMGNCGNGIVENSEACDDGNQVDDLTCSADCQSYCGDGVLDQPLGEACDGADLGNQTCENLGYGPGTLACQGCAMDASGCAPVCGDGVCQDGEYPDCSEDCAVVSVSCGNAATCAILADGSARCWGTDSSGELGTANADAPHALVPAKTLLHGADGGPDGLGFGLRHVCAIVDGGNVSCWGWNYFGQLGNGSNDDSSVPVTVVNIDNAVDVACGEVHTCAILADGTVRCWGKNSVGRLGNGLDLDSSVPVHPLI